jgi:thiamine-monophosphate kinase
VRRLLFREDQQGVQGAVPEMKISGIGGEFAFIRRVTGVPCDDPALVKGIGDDCAVLEYSSDKYLLVTTDMMVENSHFSLAWCSPYQLGKKIVEVNVSDIVAMGGTPRWAFISLALPTDTQVEFMDEFYRGLYDSGRAHKVTLAGGDTTHGGLLTLNLALVGDAEKDLVRYRSGALPGDLICVTGTLGKSEAGLRLLMKGLEGNVAGYCEPRARTEWEGKAIARRAHAMIDVSDGLGSEVRHLCEESGTGGRIDCEKIPLSRDTIEAARLAGGDPLRYALYGGEDYELVFAIPSDRIRELEKEFSDFTVVGEFLNKEKGVSILRDGRVQALEAGYDHFA